MKFDLTNNLQRIRINSHCAMDSMLNINTRYVHDTLHICLVNV